MRKLTHIEQSFLLEACLLALAAPLLYFPARFPTEVLGLAVFLLAGGWMVRRLRLGVWYVRTPTDWALVLLLVIMLPIAVWAAPLPLREQYSWPRAYILLWNFALFAFVVTYSSQTHSFLQILTNGFLACGAVIAGGALLGINWLYKFRGFDWLLAQIPTPLVGVFGGADSGFHPNEVSGTLLYVLPLMLVWTAHHWRRRNPRGVTGLITLATLGVTLVLLATQSRGGLLGFGVGCLALVLLPSRWGRWLFWGGGVCTLLAIPFLPASLLALISDAPPVEALGGMGTLSFRQEVWTQALNAIGDFAFTGMGLGTFRQVVRLLYPLNVAPDYDIAHAHNFFLQGALDFGIPGLVAILALYLTAVAQLWRLWRGAADNNGNTIPWRTYALGLTGCLIAQTVYSQLDAVTLGAKPNFMFWYLFALIYGAGNLRLQGTP